MLRRKSATNLGKTLRKNKLLLFLTLLALFFGLIWQFKSEASDERQEEGIFNLSCIQENSLVAVSEHFLTYSLYGIKIPCLLYRIIECESNFNPDACNGENCEKGRGLGQLVSETEKDCERELEREIDPFDPIDNLKCCLWLYEKRGTDPWGCPYCEWGSYSCWSKYLGN